jgi:hypothetical protein
MLATALSLFAGWLPTESTLDLRGQAANLRVKVLLGLRPSDMGW